MRKLIFEILIILFYSFCCVRHFVFTLSHRRVPINNITMSKIRSLCDRFAPKKCVYNEYEQMAKLNKSRNMAQVNRDLVCSSEFGPASRDVIELVSFEKQCPFLWRRRSVYFGGQRDGVLYKPVKFSIKSSHKWQIVNKSIGILKINKYLSWAYGISFVDFKGVDIESKITLNENLANELEIKNGFNLYRQTQIVKSCDDFVGSKSNGFIFELQTKYIMLANFRVIRPKSKHPICSLFFRSARIENLYLIYMVNSFYSKSQLTFSDSLSKNDLNCSINSLKVNQIYGLDLDSRFLNPNVFAKLESIELSGQVGFIEPEVFKPFRNLKIIWIEVDHVSSLIRKQGIEWIKQINSELNVSLTNQTDVDVHKNYIKKISCNYNRKFWSGQRNHLFDENDFCLFVDFPFHQMVFLFPTYNEDSDLYRTNTRYTCTELWLMQYFNISQESEYIRSHFWSKLERLNFTACLFQERVKVCQKNIFQKTPTKKVTPLDLVILFEFIFLISAPILSVFCTITSLMTIYVIFNSKNKKTMREKHYLYMSLYCLSNIIICFSHLISLMSECQHPFGFFCSSIHRAVIVQYIKIIFGEYLNNTCRLFSNFAYLGFSLCRLAKIGKDHGKLIVLVNDLSIVKYSVISLVMSAGMAICKPLQYKFQIISQTTFRSEYYAYPLPIFQFSPEWQFKTRFVVLFVFVILFNILNYFLFVFVHLAVDLVLIKKLVRVLGEKVEKMREMKKSSKELEEASKGIEESKRRAVFMVVLNSTFNFCSRTPLMIMSANDLRLLIQNNYFQLKEFSVSLSFFLNRLDEFDAWFTWKFYCSIVKSCLVFQSFGNCLFLFSLSFVLYFLKHFDNNFKMAYEIVFNKKTSSKKQENSLKS